MCVLGRPTGQDRRPNDAAERRRTTASIAALIAVLLAYGGGEGWGTGRARAEEPSPATANPAANDAGPPPSVYELSVPGLKVVSLDTHERESFLGMYADPAGRLFVGGREALFVYEPSLDSPTGLGPRQELYRFPDHTWIYDVVARGNDLYVLTVSALYRLPDAVTKRQGIEAQRLIWGVPLGHVHQCFHGLALGPEGDLYFAMGDPLWYYGDFARPDHWGHWTFFSQPEGTRTPYHGVGGVFRCRPDGSRFQIVARGLRNSCGLCFDRDFQLFTNDNDHEGLPAYYVPGRLIHVTPHAYFNWPQGWLLSKTPERADLLETMIDTLGRAVPVGQAYYDDPLLPESYRHRLLVARWGIRQVTSYPLEPRGASFKVTEETLLTGADVARPVSVHVGRGGRIFVTVAHMAHNEGSPVYRSDLLLITAHDDAAPYQENSYEPTRAPTALLFKQLDSTAFSHRWRAHQELLRRGGEVFAEAARRLSQVAADAPAAVHLVWLAAAGETPEIKAQLQELVRHGSATLRLQAMRALHEHRDAYGLEVETFLAALRDPSPHVQHAALTSLFDATFDPFPAEIVNGPARSDDTYLRQAAVLLLAEKAPHDLLESMSQSFDPKKRLAAVLAAGFRLTLPPAVAALPPDVPLGEPRGPEIPFAEGTVDLRTLGPIGNYTVADLWKHGRRAPMKELAFELLLRMLDDREEAVRLQAAQHLYLLNDPRSEPAVARIRRDSEDRRLGVAALRGVDRLWVIGPFDDAGKGFETVHPVETAPLDPTVEHAAGERSLAWQELKPSGNSAMYNLGEKLSAGGGTSSYAMFRLESAGRQRVNVLFGSDDGVRVWRNGELVWENDIRRGALPTQDTVALELTPGANDFLVRVRNQDGGTGLYVHYRSLQPAAHSLPEKILVADLAERLKGAEQGPSQLEEFLKVDWPQAVATGDAERGQKLFEALSCAKCHGIAPEANVVGGPSLADAGRRFSIPYLVEAILTPSKQVSPVFRATGIVTKSGEQLTGLVVGETGEKVELLQPDAKRVTLDRNQIEELKPLALSPMPLGIVKTPAELADLLAFLLRKP